MRTRAGQQSKHTQRPRLYLTIRIITVITAIIIHSKTISTHITYGLQLNEHGLVKHLEDHQLGTSAAGVSENNPSIPTLDIREAFKYVCVSY